MDSNVAPAKLILVCGREVERLPGVSADLEFTKLADGSATVTLIMQKDSNRVVVPFTKHISVIPPNTGLIVSLREIGDNISIQFKHDEYVLIEQMPQNVLWAKFPRAG